MLEKQKSKIFILVLISILIYEIHWTFCLMHVASWTSIYFPSIPSPVFDSTNSPQPCDLWLPNVSLIERGPKTKAALYPRPPPLGPGVWYHWSHVHSRAVNNVTIFRGGLSQQTKLVGAFWNFVAKNFISELDRMLMKLISDSDGWLKDLCYYIQSVPKKMSFLGKMAITTLKFIQNAKIWGVLENSGYLLPDGHWDFQNWRRNDWENEA